MLGSAPIFDAKQETRAAPTKSWLRAAKMASSVYKNLSVAEFDADLRKKDLLAFFMFDLFLYRKFQKSLFLEVAF